MQFEVIQLGFCAVEGAFSLGIMLGTVHITLALISFHYDLYSSSGWTGHILVYPPSAAGIVALCLLYSFYNAAGSSAQVFYAYKFYFLVGSGISGHTASTLNFLGVCSQPSQRSDCTIHISLKLERFRLKKLFHIPIW